MKRLLQLFGLLLISIPAQAQVDRAVLTGTVKDEQGAVIPGASLAVTHSGTNVATRVVTTAEGVYLAPNLIPGTYTVLAEASGFGSQSRAVILEVGQRARIDFTLKVGGMSEAVTVGEATRLLDTTQAVVGSVIDQTAVARLPLAIRNWDDLMVLVPGVQGDRFTEESGGTAAGRTGGVNVHGNRSLQNNFLLDGVDNNSISENVQELTTQVSRPSIDAIEEFKIVTSPYSAEYGRAPGGAISVTTKSGTNALRGTAYYYLRDEKFDSNTYFNEDFRTEHNLVPLPKPSNAQDQFGFNVGGPVIKDRLFFFADYEGTRITRGTTRSTRVPTMEERQGLFTTAIKDPLTGQNFPGNAIPASRIDPVAAAIFGLLPAPNTNETNNYVRPDANITDDADRMTGKVDFRASDKSTFFARYIYTDRDRSIPGVFGGVIDGTGTSAFGDQKITSNGLVLGWTRIFGPSVVNEFRFSWSAVDSDAVQQPFGQVPPPAALVPGVPQDPLFAGGVIGVTIDGYFGGGGLGRMGSPDFLPKFQHTSQWEFLNTLSWIKGAHQLKFGVDVLAPMKNEYLDVPAMRGSVRYRGRFTGNAVADYLLGLTADAQLSNLWVVNQRHWATSFFVHDDWRLSPKLTLNLGLRYDFITPALEADNNQLNFDPAGSGSVFAATDGSLEERGLVSPDKNNFAPRVGLVYQVSDTLVLRAGYGIFYNLFDRIGSEDQLALNPPGLINNSLSTSSTTTPLFLLKDGFPGNFLDPAQLDYRRIRLRAADQDASKTTMHQFSVGAQKVFAGSYVLSLDLVGVEGRNLANLINLNQPEGGAGPLPYPNFGFIEWRQQNATSSYKGMDLGLQRRFKSGWGASLAYTLSDCTDQSAEHLSTGGSPSFPQDAKNLAAWEGPCGYDTRHRFVGSFVVELPFAKQSTGLTKAVLANWRVSGIYAYRTGRPFTVFQGSNNVGQSMTGMPNQVGSGEGPQTVDKWFEPADFQAVPSGTFGNAKRNILRGPDWQSFDFSLQKDFPVGRTSLNLRWDVFNVFNTVNLGLPDSNIANTATVGQIRSLSGDPRIMQFSLRFMF
jgi:Carboxypeptidase regulatory-like domain/TonB dependent receptor/TonB-dependent Receptor Plug Domain